MKTLTELGEHLNKQEGGNSAYYMGYKEAISGILEDIKYTGVTSVSSIEKYLNNLLK